MAAGARPFHGKADDIQLSVETRKPPGAGEEFVRQAATENRRYIPSPQRHEIAEDS